MEKLVLDFVIGIGGYMARKYVGEEVAKYVVKPVSSRLKKYIFRPISSKAKSILIKTEKDMAIYLHYKNRAIKKNHRH